MPILVSERATSQEISNRIDRLRMQYAGNPLVKRIDHHIGVDWSHDPAVFIDVILPGNEIAASELERRAEADSIRERDTITGRKSQGSGPEKKSG